MLKRLFHRELLLFLALTSVIWALITVSKAERSTTIVIYANSPSSIVEDQFITDTSIALNVEVSASGINALRLQKVDKDMVVVEASAFALKSEGMLVVKSAEIIALLNSTYRGIYTFSTATAEILFPCEELERTRVPITIEGIQNISLPSDYKWLHSISVDPDSIDVVGSTEAVFRARLRVDLPNFLWDGNHAFELPVEGLGSSLAAVSDERVEVRGASALWIENKFEVPFVIGNQIVDVKIWVSGPKKGLLSRTFEELVALTAVQNEINYTIEAAPLKENISVLSVTPNMVELMRQ
ncbi:MAG TPA: hypothetical protein DIT65_05895 [Cryomorphaceae bacterium]|nr:hypothetical protein [Cryomorphaceae bacterium]|tara:strand:+ start:246 stop:1136 length:891 start_codon:yes stop_codon:yes gene_type:complete